jgi:putative ABC transport system substrate-binding protein
MRRRGFAMRLAAVAGALALPAAAQQFGRQYRVGVLCPFDLQAGQAYLAALRERLASHGFVEGRNLRIDARAAYWYEAKAAQLTEELIAQKVDLIFSLTTILTQGAQRATREVPIVFAWVADPVLSGIVKDYARPGGNTTGVSNRFFELWAKRLELLRELVPGARRLVVLVGVLDATLETALRVNAPVAERLGVEIVIQEARGQWNSAIRVAMASKVHAVFVGTPFAQFGRREAAQQVVLQAMELRIPAMYADLESVELGGLASYSYDSAEEVRRGADYVARVLKGAKPGELPIDQAARFQLVVNLRTARALGLTIPQSLLIRADRVIE